MLPIIANYFTKVFHSHILVVIYKCYNDFTCLVKTEVI